MSDTGGTGGGGDAGTTGRGPRIAGYADFERIGAGGFSTVYKARQEAFDRTVAVKVLAVELVDADAQRRFQRECRAHGRLSHHPHIVTVLDSGFTDDGRPYIASEFMPNGALSDRIDREGALPVRDVLDIGVKLCGALAAVHEAGVVHRDLKPQNVLVSEYGEPELADFGISAITVGPEASTGTSSLTPLHTAPEVLMGQTTSVASDLYSLGSTLYLLLAGRAPFEGPPEEGLVPLLRRVVDEPVPDIPRPDVPPAVMDLLRYTLAKDPAARYPSAVSLGEAIQATQAHLGYPVTPLLGPGGEHVSAPSVPPPGAITGEPQGAQPSTTGETIVPAAVAAAPAGGAPAGGAPAGPDTTGPSTTGPTPVGGGGGSKVGLLVGLAVIVVLVIVGAAVALTRSSSDDRASGSGGAVTAPAGDGGDALSTGDGGSTDSTDTTEPGGVGDLRWGVQLTGVLPDGDAPTSGGVLAVAIGGGSGSWDPFATRFGTSGEQLVAYALFEPLAVLGDSGPEPYLASSITPNSDYTEWRIGVPGGVTFHDGTELDAEVVARNLTVAKDSELLASVLAPIDSVETSGSEVVVTMSTPWSTFPVALAGQAGLMTAPSMLDDTTGSAKPVGTGPFELRSAEGSTIALQRFADYRTDGEPVLDGIEFTVEPDSTARRALLESGKVDLLYTTDGQDLSDLLDHPQLKVDDAIDAAVLLNTSRPPLDDVRARQALAYATDTTSLGEAAFGSYSSSTSAAFPLQSPWASSDISYQYYSVTQAQDLLAELGQPLTVSILTSGSARQKVVADALAAQWQAAGIDATVRESADDQALLAGDFDVALWSYEVPTHPDQWWVWFHTWPGGGFDWNLGGFSDREADSAFDKARQTDSLDEQQPDYAVVDERLTEAVPAIWWAALPAGLVGTDRIVGWDTAATGGLARGGTPWANRLGFK